LWQRKKERYGRPSFLIKEKLEDARQLQVGTKPSYYTNCGIRSFHIQFQSHEAHSKQQNQFKKKIAEKT